MSCKAPKFLVLYDQVSGDMSQPSVGFLAGSFTLVNVSIIVAESDPRSYASCTFARDLPNSLSSS